jgi:predicted protein tyrosine phosphatase
VVEAALGRDSDLRVSFADVLFEFGWSDVGSVIKKRRKRMAKKKHRKLLKKTRVQRRKLGK